MKKLVIFVNGNFVSTVMTQGPNLDAIISNLSDCDGQNVSFDTKAGAHVFLRHDQVDGYYVTDYVEPKKDTTSQELLNLIKNMASGGDEWRNQT